MALSSPYHILHIYLTDAVAFTTLQFGTGYGEIFLNNVVCTGSENDLNSCSHSAIGSTGTCTHANDAAVRCQGESLSIPALMLKSSSLVTIFSNNEK